MESSSNDSAGNYDNYATSGPVDRTTNVSSTYAPDALNLPYAVCEIIVAISAVIGNGLVILVFSKDRKLRRRTNYYIISLATADLLVGLFAIPFAILASIGLPTNLHACLFTVSVLVVLCTISIFCLVAVSVDRYWAILHPMGYARNVRTKTAIEIICACWIAGTLVGFLPLLGWNAGKKSDEKCIFVEVMDYDYLVFLYFATIIFPALLIAAFYAHIYRVVVKQLRQIVTMNPGRRTDNQTTGTMLRLLGAAQKRDVKVTQNLSRIVAFFIICWFPLYTINCVKAFCPDCEVNQVLLNSCIILSHLNSVGNPILYAYHLKDFRAALKSFMYGLLFPSSHPTKNKRPSVISEDRGSLRGSLRSNPRINIGTANHRTPKTSLLRRATDNATAAGAAGGVVFSQGQTKVDSTVESGRGSAEIPHESGSNSPTSALISEKKQDDAFDSPNVGPNGRRLVENIEGLRTNDPNGSNDCENGESDTSSIVPNLDGIELRTFKSFVRFAEPDTKETDCNETTESIFVTEVDVNEVTLMEKLTTSNPDSTVEDRTITKGKLAEG